MSSAYDEASAVGGGSSVAYGEGASVSGSGSRAEVEYTLAVVTYSSSYSGSVADYVVSHGAYSVGRAVNN